MNSSSNETAYVASIADGPIGRIILDQPQRRNALSLAMMHALIGAIDQAADCQDIRVIVLSGRGPAFSAGHDIAEMASNHNEGFYSELFSVCTELMERVHAVRVPVIAQVHGVATAAGCQLVAACDLAICSSDARFATPGVNIGLFCSTPMVPISRAIGRKRAMEMLLTGQMIDAATAVDWGLVNRAVDADRLIDEVDTLAHTIARASERVIGLGKQAFWQQIDASEHEAYAMTASVMANNAMLDDAQIGMNAFLEKRPPVWPTS